MKKYPPFYLHGISVIEHVIFQPYTQHYWTWTYQTKLHNRGRLRGALFKFISNTQITINKRIPSLLYCHCKKAIHCLHTYIAKHVQNLKNSFDMVFCAYTYIIFYFIMIVCNIFIVRQAYLQDKNLLCF